MINITKEDRNKLRNWAEDATIDMLVFDLMVVTKELRRRVGG